MLLLIPMLFSCAHPDIKEQKKVLIYTRNGEGYIHGNIDASVKALQEYVLR